MIPSLLNFAFHVAGKTFAILCVFEGVRRISAHGLSKNAVISVAFGFLYCVVYAGISYGEHNVQHSASEVLRKGANVPETPIDWGANFSSQQRADSSLALARAAFNEHGKLRYYFNEMGKRLMFAPSQTELDKRVSMAAQLATLDSAVNKSADAYAEWLFTAMAAALFGFLRSRQRSAN